MSLLEERMPLNIKSDEAHRLARELAQQLELSITDAVTLALRESLAHQGAARLEERDRKLEALNRISTECAALPILDARTADEILGYDEAGVPR